LNEFVLDPASVDISEIQGGGPPRDGIPALFDPPSIAAAEAPWSDDELVLGVAWNGEARAYPIAILEWHELVNDTVGGLPVLVSYCPLCGTGIVFDRRVGGAVRSFGVSGLLYRSDLLLYDRETESLWSQIGSEAVTGPALGTRLRLVRSRMTRWSAWRAEHPNTTAMSPKTGHQRRYGTSPYGDYAVSKRLLFPVSADDRYHPKTPTIGLRVPGGASRAYPAEEIVRAGGRAVETFAGHRVSVAYDPEQQTFRVDAPPPIEVIEGFWFAWAAFHPESTVFSGSQPKK
jgi:hypothetical protein